MASNSPAESASFSTPTRPVTRSVSRASRPSFDDRESLGDLLPIPGHYLVDGSFVLLPSMCLCSVICIDADPFFIGRGNGGFSQNSDCAIVGGWSFHVHFS